MDKIMLTVGIVAAAGLVLWLVFNKLKITTVASVEVISDEAQEQIEKMREIMFLHFLDTIVETWDLYRSEFKVEVQPIGMAGTRVKMTGLDFFISFYFDWDKEIVRIHTTTNGKTRRKRFYFSHQKADLEKVAKYFARIKPHRENGLSEDELQNLIASALAMQETPLFELTNDVQMLEMWLEKRNKLKIQKNKQEVREFLNLTMMIKNNLGEQFVEWIKENEED